MGKIDKSKEKKLKASEKIIFAWWKDRLRVGKELRRIRDGKLYETGWGTFEEYVKARFGWTRDNAYKLISASNVVESLDTRVENGIQNERQARALKAVPREEREAVVKEAAKEGKVTAAGIERAAKEIAPKSDVEMDGTGMAVPKELTEDWGKAHSLTRIFLPLESIAREVESSLEDQDPLWAEITNVTVVNIRAAASSLKRLLPFAVCPSCSGVSRDSCTLCRKRGFISEFLWKTAVPKEMRTMREKNA